MHRACGELPQQPTINGAKAQAAIGLGCSRLGVVLQQPLHLAGTEIGVEHQPRALLPALSVRLLTPVAANGSGPPVLPDQGRAAGLALIRSPEHRGFALIGDATGGHSSTLLRAQLVLQLLHGLQLAAPNRQRVLFHPTVGGVLNRQRDLRRCQRLSAAIENHGAGAAGALIKGQQERFGHALHHHPPVLTRLSGAFRQLRREID